MKKRYIIHMKNGDKIEISKEKYDSFSELITKEKYPLFLNVDGNLLNFLSISHCTAEDSKWT